MIPVIDLFAGPGGLGEGFSAFRDAQGQQVFRIALSIEKDFDAHDTLLLRSFVRHFAGDPPPAYFAHLKDPETASRDDLFAEFPAQAMRAQEEAWCAELGTTPDREIHARIGEALRKGSGRQKQWVLIGGPPCQAYSLVGRARRTGEDRALFDSDSRHVLYREYLKILKSFQPTAFVMENVKGLLSSRHEGGRIVSRIMNDLRGAGYRLYSLATGTECDEPQGFVVKCEVYGVPQRRHRLIIVGVHNSIKRQPRQLGRETGPSV
ncbi:MAG: DNA cytosine methyltransferase, partial [Terriglobales bacterium]